MYVDVKRLYSDSMDGVVIWAVARPLSATLSVFGSKPTRDNIVGIHQMLF